MTDVEWTLLKPNDTILFMKNNRQQAKYRLLLQDHFKAWIAARIDFYNNPIAVRILRDTPELFAR